MMQPDAATLSQLEQVLRGTLAADTATRRAATTHLEQAESTPGFSIVVLTLAQNGATDPVVRLAAVTLFKNFVRRNWKNDEDCIISEGDKTAIKANLVNLMSSVPPLVQRQARSSPREITLTHSSRTRLRSPGLVCVPCLFFAAATAARSSRT